MQTEPRCACCGIAIEPEWFAGAFQHEGEMQIVCDGAHCLRWAADYVPSGERIRMTFDKASAGFVWKALGLPPYGTAEPERGEWSKDRPNSGGWWLWREGEGHAEPVKLLLSDTGLSVADDDEWEQATGRNAGHDGWSENYWEGTETTQKTMPGLWMKCANTPAEPERGE